MINFQEKTPQNFHSFEVFTEITDIFLSKYQQIRIMP